ncbi:hypothetical protein [Campylobacter concisus]|uniref:hypothetical protein n=1 Tax=Campylobacter concisus TaxID=199 RepID=UPI000D31D7E8|nr:hypothetical protein [Campylobacter concisus]
MISFRVEVFNTPQFLLLRKCIGHLLIPQDYIDSLNDELPPENISIRVEDDEDIELHAQFDNTDYINSDIVSDNDMISEEEIQNGTGYELEEKYVGSDEDAEDDSFSVL